MEESIRDQSEGSGKDICSEVAITVRRARIE